MKKILLVSMVLMVVSSTSFARRATDKPAPLTGVAIMNSGSVFKVFYKGTTPGDVKVSIVDAQDKVVFTETLRKVDAFVRPYNFEGLAEGKYTIEVIDAYSLQVKKVNYSKGNVEKLVGLVHIAGKDSKFLLTIPNKGTETFTVKIFNEHGELLYDGKEETQGDFAKVYNLQKATGKFTFEVTDKKGSIRTISY